MLGPKDISEWNLTSYEKNHIPRDKRDEVHLYKCTHYILMQRFWSSREDRYK